MRFHQRSLRKPAKLGVLAGSFNPPTVAHYDLADAARGYVDEVLCVVPSVFPHKEYFGATLEQRMQMLAESGLINPCSIATSEKGLFIDIARECREHYGGDTRLYFICGRDAAERILNWDYVQPGIAEDMFGEFELLVAARDGEFEAPPKFQERIHRLRLRSGHDRVSSTEVRERIARAEPWEHLVPPQIVERVRKIYS